MSLDLIPGKNPLWLAYQMAHPVVRKRIQADLNKVSLYKHWQQVASKEGYNLPMAKGKLIKIFLKHMPETAPFFDIKPRRAKQPSPAPLFDETQPQPQN